MATVLDDINAVATSDAAVATANQGVATAQAALTAAQAQVTTAQAADTASDQQLSADLQASGPVFVSNQDGSATFYAFSPDAPGFTKTQAQPAGGVNNTPAPTPTPSPTSTTAKTS